MNSCFPQYPRMRYRLWCRSDDAVGDWEGEKVKGLRSKVKGHDTRVFGAVDARGMPEGQVSGISLN